MAATYFYSYDATTADIDNVIDIGEATASTYIILYYWYNGKRYKTKKEAKMAQNKYLAQETVYWMMRDKRPVASNTRNVKVYKKVVCLRPQTSCSQRQLAYHKRKHRLHRDS